MDNLFDSRTTTNYLYSVVDPNFEADNPGRNVPGPMYANFTFRPRTIGITATYRR